VLPPPGFTYFTLGNAEVTTKAEPAEGRQRKGKKKAHAHALTQDSCTHGLAHGRQAGRHGDSSCMYVPYSFSIIFGTRVPDCPLTGPIAVPYLRIFL
jgi:hypothetical protein